MGTQPIKSGVFAVMFTKIAAAANAAAPAMVEAIARQCKDKARENLSQHSHAYGTPTPASPGGPPAMISGTLRDAVDVEDAHLEAGGWIARVGVLSGRTPPYGRTEAAVYGEILETGETRDGQAWPWLQPAFDDAARGGAMRAAKTVRSALGRL